MKLFVNTMIFIALLAGILLMLPNPEVSGTNNTEAAAEYDSTTENSLHLTNITLFDGQDWHENSALFIIDGLISDPTSNQSTDQDSLPIIDGKNGFIIPGLIDAHTHTWGTALQEALVFGVTTELDMFSELNFAQQARLSRNLIEKTTQADFYSAGTLITSPGGHGTQFGFAIPTIDDAALAEQFVSERINEGSDYIKIVYHHEDEYYGLTSISKELLTALIKATHKYEKLAVVHISDHQAAVDAVEAGADGLVHTFGDQLIDEDLLFAMKQRGVFIIPTLSVIASMAQSSHSVELGADENLSQMLSDSSKNGLKPFSNLTAHPATLATAIENTRLMHDYGIVVLAGSDAPNPGTAHGISMHGELELLNQAGLSPTAALKAAGSLAAKQFPIGQRGVLTVGAKADFIWLTADPRTDIKHTRKIEGVWKNGYLVEAKKSSQPSQSHSLTLPDAGLLSDFSAAALKSSMGTDFIHTSDQMMQGNSTAAVSWTDSGCHGGGLLVEGEIKAGFPYAWSGAFLPFSKNMEKALNLESAHSIDFNVSGHPGSYQLMVFTLNNMQPVQLPFEITDQCLPVSFNISAHPVVDWNNVTGLAWVADRSRLKPALASFAFKLDNIVIK